MTRSTILRPTATARQRRPPVIPPLAASIASTYRGGEPRSLPIMTYSTAEDLATAIAALESGNEAIAAALSDCLTLAHGIAAALEQEPADEIQ